MLHVATLLLSHTARLRKLAGEVPAGHAAELLALADEAAGMVLLIARDTDAKMRRIMERSR